LALAGGSRAFAAASAAATATGVATAGNMGSLDANLHAVHATSHGTNHALLSLRSLLTPAQVERLRRAQQEAAEEAADAALAAGVAYAPPPSLTSAVDPAPVVATLELRGCGGVGRLACLSDRLLVAATNLGEVVMIEVASSSDDEAGMGASVAATPLQRRMRPAASASSKTALQLRAVHTFTDLHPNSGSSTALATHLSSSTPLLASVSDDGSLALMAPFTRQVLRRVPHAHPSALFSATFGLGGCLHTAGMGGTISTFDLRAGGGSGGGFSVQGLSKPSSLLFDANAVSITSLAVHPTRPHLLAAGSSNGSLSIFDVRRSSSSSSSSLASSAVTPLCSIQAQKAAVLDLAFLPWAPQQLLSCSDDGSLCCFHFGAEGGDTGASGDEAFLASAVQQSMRPSKLVQNTSAIRALAIDREARTVLAATDAPSLLSCVL
jgi:WD40 repeat protein